MSYKVRRLFFSLVTIAGCFGMTFGQSLNMLYVGEEHPASFFMEAHFTLGIEASNQTSGGILYQKLNLIFWGPGCHIYFLLVSHHSIIKQHVNLHPTVLYRNVSSLPLLERYSPGRCYSNRRLLYTFQGTFP